MWWLFTKKIQKHPELKEGETVFQACYGLGNQVVEHANRSLSHKDDTWNLPQTGVGLASPLNQTGVVALTNLRLLYFAKRLAIGNVKSITADWPLAQIDTITYTAETLTIRFTDGSAGGLHVPKNQSPQKLVAAWHASKN